LDVQKIRKDFPALIKNMDDERKLPIYFDNTSVTLMPKPVLNAVMDYYNSPGNLRSAHEFSINTMMKCNTARERVSKLINASSSNNIIWTKNATEAINLVSRSLDLKPGDIVLTTDKEHNSNLVPWHSSKGSGIDHQIIRSGEDNKFDINEFEKKISDDVKLVSMAYTSIIDGYSIPVEKIIKLSHKANALVLLDSVLTVPCQPIDVQKLDIDFLVFSISNMCGPNGIGVLYGKEGLLNQLEPYMGGGGANTDITYKSSTFQGPPAKFEAGSQNCAGIIGAGAAVEYLQTIGLDNIKNHLYQLNKQLTDDLIGLENISILGPQDPRLRSGMFNFNITDINPHDIAISLEELGGILVRSGHLCAHSWFEDRNSNGTVSVSLYIYNSDDEIEQFTSILKKLITEFF
jgi:cysteine desulfurase/selenocysteine lyase